MGLHKHEDMRTFIYSDNTSVHVLKMHWYVFLIFGNKRTNLSLIHACTFLLRRFLLLIFFLGQQCLDQTIVCHFFALTVLFHASCISVRLSSHLFIVCMFTWLKCPTSVILSLNHHHVRSQTTKCFLQSTTVTFMC